MTIDRRDCTADKHGTRTAYHNWGCRCADAREAERIALKRRREGRTHTGLVNSIGTARRLQSLVAAGHSQRELGKAIGVSDQRIHQLITPWRTQITADTEKIIRTLFRRLDGTDGGSTYARNVARKKNWYDAAVWDDIDDPHEKPKLGSPHADIVDPVLVERVLTGECTATGGSQSRLDHTNRRAAVQVACRRGVPLKSLSARLRVAPRTTDRIAAALRQLEHSR